MEDNILTVRHTIIEMLEDRGYDRSQIPYNIGHKYLLDAIKRFEAGIPSLDIFITKPRKIYVRFVYQLQHKKDDYGGFKNFTRIMMESNRMTEKDEIVFVVFDSTFDKTKIVDLEDNTDNVNVFFYKQLLFNVSKHQLVPPHEKVDDDKKKSLKKELMITNFSNLPLIYKSDPVCKYYNFRKGDVIKIHRPSMGNKEHISYRYVV